MDPRLHPLLTTLRLNTHLFLACLAGVPEEVGARRASAETNSMAFLAAHLVDVRHVLARLLGVSLPNPVAGALEGARGIDDVRDCPTLEVSRAAWIEVSEALARRFAALAPDELDRPTAQRFPIGDRSLLGAVTFLAQHDAYHIGQLALLRKLHGQGAMSYAGAAAASAPPPAGGAPATGGA